jgi:hypothetical protein
MSRINFVLILMLLEYYKAIMITNDITYDNELITEPFKRKVLKAMEHPYKWPEIEQLTANERLLAQKYLYGNLKKEEFNQKLKQIQSEKPSIIVKSITELEFIMELLEVDDAIKNETIKDMTFSYEKAVKQGYQCRFSIWFYKSFQRRLAMYCGTQIKI